MSLDEELNTFAFNISVNSVHARPNLLARTENEASRIRRRSQRLERRLPVHQSASCFARRSYSARRPQDPLRCPTVAERFAVPLSETMGSCVAKLSRTDRTANSDPPPQDDLADPPDAIVEKFSSGTTLASTFDAVPESSTTIRLPSHLAPASNSFESHQDVQVKQYLLKEQLGRGAQALVRLAVDTSDDERKKYAIKIVRKRSPLKRMRRGGGQGRNAGKYGFASGQISREIAIMKKLRHEHILELREILDDPNESRLFLVMEFVDGGPVMKDTLEKQTPLEERVARDYFRQLLSGVEYLHHHGVVHRDIKPSNLLVDSRGLLKISDFGVSMICKPITKGGRESVESTVDEHEGSAFLHGSSSSSSSMTMPNKVKRKTSNRNALRVKSHRSSSTATSEKRTPREDDYNSDAETPPLFSRKRLAPLVGSSSELTLDDDDDENERESEEEDASTSPLRFDNALLRNPLSVVRTASGRAFLPNTPHLLSPRSPSAAAAAVVGATSSVLGNASREASSAAAIEHHDDVLSARIGTYAFLPPEACSGENVRYFGKAADLWAASVTLYVFLFGFVPFLAFSESEMLSLIVQAQVKFPLEIGTTPVSSDAVRFLTKILSKKRSSRPTLSRMKKHAWIVKDAGKMESLSKDATANIDVTEDDVSKALTDVNLSVAVRLLVRSKSWSSKTDASIERNLRLLRSIELSRERATSIDSMISSTTTPKTLTKRYSVDSDAEDEVEDPLRRLLLRKDSVVEPLPVTLLTDHDTISSVKDTYRPLTAPVRRLRPEGLLTRATVHHHADEPTDDLFRSLHNEIKERRRRESIASSVVSTETTLRTAQRTNNDVSDLGNLAEEEGDASTVVDGSESDVEALAVV